MKPGCQKTLDCQDSRYEFHDGAVSFRVVTCPTACLFAEVCPFGFSDVIEGAGTIVDAVAEFAIDRLVAILADGVRNSLMRPFVTTVKK